MTNSGPFENPYQQSTAVKNIIFDRIMPTLSANGWKVLCVAIRQTWGWVDYDSPTGRKESDVISYSQFKAKTGIKSNATISRALSECLELGYLLRRQVGTHQGTGKPILSYALNVGYRFPASSKIEQADSASSKIEQAASSKIEQAASSKIEHTKTIKTKKSNGDDDEHRLDLLLAAGVWQSQAEIHAQRYTLDEIQRVIEVSNGANNPGAAIHARLTRGDVPQAKREKRKKANYLVGVCAKCHARPCMCD